MSNQQNDTFTVRWWEKTMEKLGAVMNKTGVHAARIWCRHDNSYSYELIPVSEMESESEMMIREECEALCRLLVEKNRAYGNSALDPVRIFSQADPVEQIRVRIDDKLSRLARGQAAGEDVELDLLGYLVLLRIAKRLEARKDAG